MRKPAINWGNVCRVHAERLAELARENQEQAILFGNVSSHEASLLGRVRELERENAALREILINADELERYSGSDGRREWGKCSTWLHADDVVIIVSAKAFDAIRKEAQ